MFAWIRFLTASIMVAQPTPPAQDTAPNRLGRADRLAHELQAAPDGLRFDDAMDDFLESDPERVLDELVAASDCTVALAAGWLRLLREAPQEEGIESVSPGNEEIGRFLGLVEGRAQIVLPQWWIEAVRTVVVRNYGDRRSAIFEFPRDFAEQAASQCEGQDAAVSAAAAAAKESAIPVSRLEDNQFVVLHEDWRWTVPYPAARYLEPLASAAADARSRFVVVYDSHSPVESEYPLWAIDRNDGSIHWESEVFTGAGGGASGPVERVQTAEVRADGERVAVFGYGAQVYLNVFDAATGASICRFSSGFLWLPAAGE